jgi:sterol desaturase/sphingolipid hydroxylase (fatty acid hydroxylase superfamily)
MAIENDAAESATPAVNGPFTDITRTLWDAGGEHIPADLHWSALLLTLVIAIGIWFFRGGHGSRGADGRERKAGLLQFLLPADIYTHASARVDVYLYLFERVLYPLWAVALLATVAPATERSVIGALQGLFGATPAFESNYGWMLLYSLVALLCYDFVFFLTHYTMHKVPALWSLHKVHHSAEVLTPLTRYREHFLVGPIWAAGAAFSYGLVGGVFAYLFNGGITEATLLNLGFFAVLFGFNGAFRHYHVQFHYPRWLAKWLHSPAMHHVHHSYLPPHWDKNFAAVTSIWDRMFGTLYIPVKDEPTPWGIGPETQQDHRSFWQNMTGPFRDWYAMLRP